MSPKHLTFAPWGLVVLLLSRAALAEDAAGVSVEASAPAASDASSSSSEGSREAPAPDADASSSSESPAQDASASEVLADEAGAAEAALGDAGGLADLGDLADLLNTPIAVATVNMTVASLRDAPAVVDVIGAPELYAWGYRNIGEALTYVMGMYLLDDHTVPNLAVRGVNAGLGGEGGIVKVMIDGQPVNFRPTSGAWLGNELIPLSAVKHVEIIKGPASAVHGADAFLGVINIVTVNPSDAAPGRLRLGADFSGGWGDASVGTTLGNFNLVLAVGGELDDRSGLRLPRRSPAPIVPEGRLADRVTRDLERQSRSALAKLSYKPSGALELVELTFYHSGLERGGDFAPWAQLTAQGSRRGTVVALSQQMIANRGRLSLGENLHAQWTGSFSWGGTNNADSIEVGSDLFRVERDMAYRSLALRLDLAWDPDPRYGIAGGVEYVYDEENVGGLSRVSKTTGDVQRSTPDTTYVLGNFGAVLQAHYTTAGEALRLTGGLRVDRHNLYGTQLSGRLAAVYRASDALVLKALYGSAFKAPPAYLLFTQPLRPGDVIGNPRLGPQKVHTFELYGLYEASRYVNVTTGVAYSLLLDKAEFVPHGVNQTAQNVASMHSVAWETELALSLPNSMRGTFSAEVPLGWRDTGQAGYLSQLLDGGLTAYPRYIFRGELNGRIDLPADLGLRVGGQVVWAGPRAASDNNAFQNGAPYDLPAFAEVNALVSLLDLRLFGDRQTTFTVRATNLFDNRVADPGFAGVDVPRPGRRIFALLEQEI